MPSQSTRAERTVALLAFEDARSCPVADLMDVAQRQKTASELNAAILASQCQVGWGRVLAAATLASQRQVCLPSARCAYVLQCSGCGWGGYVCHT